jgi:hypothetical protein
MRKMISKKLLASSSIILVLMTMVSWLILPEHAPIEFNLMRLKIFPDNFGTKKEIVTILSRRFDTCTSRTSSCNVFDLERFDHKRKKNRKYLSRHGRLFHLDKCEHYNFLGRHYFTCNSDMSYKIVYPDDESLVSSSNKNTSNQSLDKLLETGDNLFYRDFLFLEMNSSNQVLSEYVFSRPLI